MELRKLHVLLPLFFCSALLAEERPETTEVWGPVPVEVDTDAASAVPSDAIVLFDGSNLREWTGEKSAEPTWTVADGVMTVKGGTGGIVTQRSFDDCQLHLEWRSPAEAKGDGQSRGNSGVYFQGRYEIQVLDSYRNPTYVNGQAASLYKQQAPLVNASRRPGEWQTYDIVFRAPRFNADGSLRRPAIVTVFHNGVLVQDHTPVQGSTAWIGKPTYSAHPFKQPLMLQDHGSAVSYRNIWIREIGDARTAPLMNGKDLDGWYSYLENLGRNQDPEGNFRVVDGQLHIRGKNFGYIATEKEYADYHLRADFRWGTLQWPPRETGKRDSGILYHFSAQAPDVVWPKSIECQVQEGDCGDIWFVGTDGESSNRSEHAWGMKRVFKEGDFERPRGEWNTMEVVAIGDRFEHYVNGHLVNSATHASVQRGKILLQSEGAEVWYRNVTLTPLD